MLFWFQNNTIFYLNLCLVATILCAARISRNSLLAQFHKMQYVLGASLHNFFTLGTVSFFSELDIHCFNANNPQNVLHYGIVQVATALWDAHSLW